MCEVQANDEMALVPLGTCGCCQHPETPPAAALCWTQAQSWAPEDGALTGATAEPRNRVPFAVQASDLVRKGWEMWEVGMGWLLLSWRLRLLAGLFSLSQAGGKCFLSLGSVLVRFV